MYIRRQAKCSFSVHFCYCIGIAVGLVRLQVSDRDATGLFFLEAMWAAKPPDLARPITISLPPTAKAGAAGTSGSRLQKGFCDFDNLCLLSRLGLIPDRPDPFRIAGIA